LIVEASEFVFKASPEIGSGVLTSMTLANGFAIVPEDKEQIRKGDKLQVMMLDWCQDI